MPRRSREPRTGFPAWSLPHSHPSPGSGGQSSFLYLSPPHLPEEKGKKAAVRLVLAWHGYIGIYQIYFIFSVIVQHLHRNRITLHIQVFNYYSYSEIISINNHFTLICNQRITAFGTVFDKLFSSGLVRDRIQMLIEGSFKCLHGTSRNISYTLW